MKARRPLRFILGAALLVSLAGAASLKAAVITVVENINPGEVTGGGTDFVSQILVGQTLYVGIPYTGGTWPTAEANDYFEVSTYLLGVDGSSTASFSFYSASVTDNGTSTELTGITELSGFTAGVVNVAQQVSTTPSDAGNLAVAGVVAQIDYNNQTGNPFSSLTEGILWLGITNTGDSDISYYTGSPFGGSPSPGYSFAAPFDTETSELHEDSYTYDSGGDLATSNQNVHPYMNVTLVTVPEPSTALLAGIAGLSLVRRRRVIR